MQLTQKSHVIEPDAAKLAVIIARDFYELEPVCGRTPLDEVCEAEERELTAISKTQETDIKTDAVSAMLAYFFAPVNNQRPNPLDVLSKVYLLAYVVRPALVQGWSLEKLSKAFNLTRQAFSKRLLQLNKTLNVRSRNQKSATHVSIYRENTTAWHAERKAKEAVEKRKNYLKKWRKANDAEVKAYQAQYRAKNRERLNAAKRKKRAKVPSE